MYKLREARLKNFYNSADVNTEIHRSTINTSSNQKTNMSTTHADSLADQSYVTLKSKEVRDSESPTRDSFNKSIGEFQIFSFIGKHFWETWSILAIICSLK